MSDTKPPKPTTGNWEVMRAEAIILAELIDLYPAGSPDHLAVARRADTLIRLGSEARWVLAQTVGGRFH
jgi:hypothetical protein